MTEEESLIKFIISNMLVSINIKYKKMIATIFNSFDII